MLTPSALSNPDAFKLLAAVELFEQTFGKSKSELDLQATIGALAAAMHLIDDELDNHIHRIASHYQQLKSPDKLIETAGQIVPESTIQKAKARLAETEETVILLIRTYLQRVSSKLTATEFVEMAKAAVALLDTHQSGPRFSLPESKRLLYIVLKTFGDQLSQPIPPLGEQLPEQITSLVTRLARYQKIIRTDGLEAVLMTLATQTLKNVAQRLSPTMVRNALQNSRVTIVPEFDNQDSLEDLASAMVLKVRLQTVSSNTTKSKQEIAEQLDQAIAEFKIKYQSLTDVTHPKWDNDLSVSSPFFTPSNFATASNDFTWVPPHIEDKSLEDETNA